ncbi:MAG: hypothetical protein WAN12_20835 [Candidatus Acidiferrum sp.]
MFWQNAFANLLGSFAAALFTWFLVTRVYEISRSKKAKGELLAVSYALILREIDACSILCREHIDGAPSHISASGPITQAWETLHSTEAFKYFSHRLSEKLVKYYSLVFRLKANIELSQLLFAMHGIPVAGASPMAAVQQRLRSLENQVCMDLNRLELQLRSVLDGEVSNLSKKEKIIFKEAYERPPSAGEPQ